MGQGKRKHNYGKNTDDITKVNGNNKSQNYGKINVHTCYSAPVRLTPMIFHAENWKTGAHSMHSFYKDGENDRSTKSVPHASNIPIGRCLTSAREVS